MGVGTDTHVGWYVGDGAGAHARLLAVHGHLGGRLTAVSVGPAPDLVARGIVPLELPFAAVDGRGGGSASEARPEGQLRSWLRDDRPDVLVVDGAPNLADVARRAGVRVVTVRRPGAIPAPPAPGVGSGATLELAPYPSLLEPASTSRWVRERTVHVGLLSRFAGRRPHRRAGRRALGLGDDELVVTVLCGADGLGPGTDLAAAAAATPTWTWVTAGRCASGASGPPANVRRLGWTDDPWSALEAADVVIGSPALSVVAEVASARRPFLVLPRVDRLGDETTARILEELGSTSTLTRWPAAGVWPAVLAAARTLDPRPLGRLEDARAASRVADWVGSIGRQDSVSRPAFVDEPHRHLRRRAAGRVPT